MQFVYAPEIKTETILKAAWDGDEDGTAQRLEMNKITNGREG